ncbi:Rhodanese-related sulfurtransferase [Desulfacinum infernum DSM 9756]|uniref:Rhodanese-related sulfurtransferase n=1 Tax=Desulfacinum infernum DSM 9756 TaxID=1121391 RepID=A0A1M4TXA8_9BACT|nr:rhodanese-like domain-containing protein [Desulfacinum infernum]SHE49043.1 Rhodanese-related sulfurtransferase [Desulfacinum infernum DSM 9756]
MAGTARESASGWWIRAAGQLLALVAAACILALLANALRSNPIPWVGDWGAAGRLETEGGDSLVISLEEAQESFFSGDALFVDARDPESYREGHILGALNLPWAMFDEAAPQVLSGIEKDRRIITYCDGEACGLSREVAVALQALGYENVRVLVNGWSVWLNAGLPTATGD